MIKWLMRGAVIGIGLVGAILLFAPATRAEPPIRVARHASHAAREGGQNAVGTNAPLSQASSPGYTLRYSFSADPKDNTYVASFDPDVEAIYAWGTITANGGAGEEQFTMDIQFLAPDGTPVESEWYGQDNGAVLTYPEDAKTFGDENVARRFVRIRGTPNAQMTGQWTVNYTVGGKLIASGNFTLADASDIAQDEQAGSAEDALAAAGYNVIEFQEMQGKNGNLFAFTIMAPASRDLYSSETTQQIVDGLAALRQAFPNSETLYVFLRYDPRYEIAYFADAPDVDAYLGSQDFDTFARAISVDVYDNEQGKYLGKSSKDFINKNFGAGTYQNPPNPPLSKSSRTIGSIRVTVSPSELVADGASKAIVSVEVFDKRNRPVPNAEVAFEVSGSGEGSIRPRVTSTDDNGQADAVFTAGRKNGAATITASAGGVTGSGVVTIGTGSADTAQDNVIAFLSTQGYNATKAGYLDSQRSAAGVIIDLGPSFKIDQVTGPIVFGMTALRINYPEATSLAVFIPYQNNLLYFPATSSEYDVFAAAASQAQTESEKRTVLTNFLRQVFAQSVYMDRNGNKLSTFKDFYNKDFAGG